MTTTTVPRLTLNPNVSHKPPAHDAMAADWPLVDEIGVIVMRGTPSYNVPLWGIDGAPAEIADYLDSLADAITTAAGLEICDGCGFRFDPPFAPPPRFGPNVVDCGRCEA